MFGFLLVKPLPTAGPSPLYWGPNMRGSSSVISFTEGRSWCLSKWAVTIFSNLCSINPHVIFYYTEETEAQKRAALEGGCIHPIPCWPHQGQANLPPPLSMPGANVSLPGSRYLTQMPDGSL